MQAFFEKHFYLVNLLVVGLCATLVGLTATNIIEWALLGDPNGAKKRRKHAGLPSSLAHQKKSSKAALRKSQFDVTRRNVFCSYCKPAKVADSGSGKSEQPTVSMDDAELLATLIALNDDKWSIATIRFKKNRQMRLVAKGTKFDGYEITKVESRRVTFTKGKQTGYIDLFPDANKAVAPTTKPVKPGRKAPNPRDNWRNAVNQGVRKVGPNKYEIDRTLVQQFIANTAMAGRDAAIYPHTKDGKPDGFRLGRVRPGGIFAKLGMRSGDVLNSVNNMPITSLDKALTIFTKLQGANHLTIGVTRYGRPQTMDYSIK
ncbi:MAG: type II secretion system protein GspC [bacterium]